AARRRARPCAVDPALRLRPRAECEPNRPLLVTDLGRHGQERPAPQKRDAYDAVPVAARRALADRDARAVHARVRVTVHDGDLDRAQRSIWSGIDMLD